MKILTVISLILLLSGGSVFGQDGFTAEDRKLLIELTVKVDALEKRVDGLEKRMDRMEQSFDARLAGIETRQGNMVAIFAAVTSILGALLIGVFSFIVWDRRSYLERTEKVSKEAIDKKLEKIQEQGKLKDVIGALRELAQNDKKVKHVLQQFNLL